MPSPDRRTTSRRRRPSPAFDRLEGRAMMSTVPTSTHALAAATTSHAHHAVAHHAAAAHHAVQAASAATKASPLVNATHHLVHLSATAHGQAKPASEALAKVPNLADIVLLHPYAKPSAAAKPKPHAAYAPVGGFNPAQVDGAYGVSTLAATNQGQGTTIAIIDAYIDPNILSDANVFSAQYGLPQFNATVGGPRLTAVTDTTFGPIPTSPPSYFGGTADETSLDIEWAHAIAPKANILLVYTLETLPALIEGVQYAAKQPGVDTVSLSYGGPDVNQGTSSIPYNATYLANGPSATLPVTVSTGDSGLPGYPATSDNVIAVGGTSLYTAGAGGTTYSYETAWGGPSTGGSGGGGPSGTYGSPTFQSANGVNYPNRSIPDLAAIADPYTGVAFYDSYDAQGGNPWNVVGGTSLAAPVVSAMIDLAQQDRIAAGKPLLNSAQINNADYAAYTNKTLYASLFNDVTQGTNEDYTSGYPFYSATTGYDLTTGLGSPKAAAFVAYLSGL